MTHANRSLFIAASGLSTPAFADSGFMGIPTDTGFGGFVLGFLLIIGVSAVAGAAYGIFGYIVEKIRTRK
jgi:hypothetical protein